MIYNNNERRWKVLEFSTILQGISNYGFPIVMCLIMIWYLKDTNEKHKEEVEKFADALNRNTLVLQKLCDKLDVESEVK